MGRSFTGADVVRLFEVDIYLPPHIDPGEVGPDAPTDYPQAFPKAVARCRELLAARRRALTVIGDGLFSDPAWDILLTLFSSMPARRFLLVHEIARFAKVPQTTTLRWLAALEQRGLVVRRSDPVDRRSTRVSLTSTALVSITRCFAPSEKC